MTTRDIQEIVQQLYGVEVSATLISEITADLDQEVSAWRTRSLEEVWPIVYFDGIVVHARNDDGRVAQRTVYVALGVDLEGHKELLGLWLGQAEGAKFWLSCLTDLRNRGLRDIFVACIDGLSGFADAIHAAYPQTKVQLCLVHLVRAALRYVSTTDSKAVAADLKKIYGAATVLEAEQALESFAQAWSEKYPTIAKMSCQAGRHHHAVRLSPGDPPGDLQGDLHHQRDRIGQQRDSQVHPQPENLPYGGVGLENRLHGHSRGLAKMDHADPQLEGGAEPLRHHLRGPDAQVMQITFPARVTQKT